MRDPYFLSISTKEHIQDFANRYKFLSKGSIEKFIKDFEVFTYIQQHLFCVLRGGMCMPFYNKSNEIKRLSIDIDLFTQASKNEIIKVMEQINNDGYELTCKEHKPNTPYPLNNLITYYVNFQSCFGSEAHIKIDFFSCVIANTLSTETIDPGRSISLLQLPKSITILSLDSLLSDKITSLAKYPIGYSKSQRIPKQIFDLGVLIRQINTSNNLQLFTTFITLTTLKLEHYSDEDRKEISLILDDILNNIDKYYDFKSAITLSKKYREYFDSFKGTYLSKNDSYKVLKHITDIMLVKLFVKHLKYFLNKNYDKSYDVNSFYDVLSNFQNFNKDENQDLCNQYYKKINLHMGITEKILQTTKSEHLYLLYHICDIE